MQYLTRASPWWQLFNDSSAAVNCNAILVSLERLFERQPLEFNAQELKAWQLSLVHKLKQLDLPAWCITKLISAHNDYLYEQAIAASLAQMQVSGWGVAPVEFCVLQLGSAARHESFLRPDQDNALIIANYPEQDYLAIDTWMQQLGELFTAKLDAAGIPLCQGHVMARWPLWRKSLASWQEQMRLWVAQPSVKKVQLTNILLDLNPVFGQASLAQDLKSYLAAILPQATSFLNIMASLLDDLNVGLDSFDRLQGGGAGAPHTQAVNLKMRGLLPLQASVKFAAVLAGVTAVGTRERLLALFTRELISWQEAQDLVQAFDTLQDLLLQAQQKSLNAGRQADNWVDLASLTPRQKQILRLDFKLIRSFQQQYRKKFVG